MPEFDVVESAALTNSVDAEGKLYKAVLVKAGWGSKMYYGADVLSKEGPTVFKAGTPIFFDHQTQDEQQTRPLGSVKDFAGQLASDAYWDAEEQGLVAEVEIFEHERPRVKSLKDHVGLSIRARTTYERGSVDGRSGRIATGLVFARSVDLVRRAGAGGRLADVLESDTEIEEEQQMEEVLAEIAKLSSAMDEKFTSVDAKFAEIQESMTAEDTTVEDATATTTEVVTPAQSFTLDDVRAVIAEALADGRTSETTVTESAEADAEGTVEDADVEESATELNLPTAWVVKESN